MLLDPSQLVHEIDADCPYCGEPISLLIDLSPGDQHYVEDCEVCCRAIQVIVASNEGMQTTIELYHENDIP